MQNQNKNSNLPIEEPIYVYFDYHGTKVSELFIPTETKSLSDLITENSFKYKIPIDLFHDLVLKNRINLSENNSYQTKNQKDLKLQEPVFNNFLEANDHLNSNNSTRCNTNKNLKGLTNNNNNNFPNSHENLEMPKQHNNKERIYNEILAFKENEIPKNKLLELTSNLLKNTNKYLKDHKNQNNDLTANANFVDKFDIRNDYNTNSVDRHKTDLHNDYNNYDNMINLNNNKSLNEVNSLNQIQLSNKNNNKINNNSNSDKNKTESKTKHNLNIINNHNNKINAANNNVDLIKKALLRSGANALKSPRSVKINLNMISGKSNNKSQGKKVNQTKSKADKGNLEKEHQSPNYNFLHTNNLLVKNYKRANNYADKEAFAKQIKGQMNQERLSAIKDSKTYAVYNYKKIIPENVHNSTNQETEEKKRNCLTNPVDNVLIDLNSKNENENEQAVIDDLELKLIDYNNYNNNNYNKTEQIEQTKAFNDTELNNVNMYNDLNNIISQNYNNINSNFNMPAKKISQSNAQYVSLKNKLDNLSNDYILNFNNKNNNNLFSSKNMIDNLLNLNLNTANNANDKNNNQNEKTQPNNFDNKNIKNNNNINFNFNNENQEEKFIGSETMSEKSSFLFNTHRKASENYQTANTNPNKNANYSINNFKANNLNNNLNTTTNLNENTNRTNYKSLSRGANLIKKLKKNQSSFSVSKSERSVSYGERLFYKGKLFEEQKGKKTEIYKKMKEIEFEKNCTFKPKINPNSIALSVKANFSKLGASSFGYADGILNNFSTPNLLNNKNNANNIYNQDENFENNLYHSYNNFENLSNFNHSGNFSNNHYNNNNGLMQNIRYKNKQCSHNPMLNNTVNFNENYKASLTGINSTSKILNKTSFKSPEEIEIVSKRLHDNAERYRNKKLLLQENYYAQTCPFSPEIISREEGVIPNMENFFNRLQNWVDKRNDKYEQDLDKKHFDQITGNRLFSPQINRSSKHNEFALNESTRERFYELYENYKKKQSKLTEINEKNAQEISFIANIAHINERSKHMVDEMQTKIFMHLFQVLSDKTSNLINGNEVDLSEIPEKIQNILMPLLSELKEQNETLTLDEFILASKHLYASLPIQFKQNLMEWYLSFNKMKKNMSIQECFNFPFKPEICERSRAIAENSKLFSANLLMKSIDQIKLKQEQQLINSSSPTNAYSQKNLKRQGNNKFAKPVFNNEVRNKMLRNYYENNEKINETLAEENNSEN